MAQNMSFVGNKIQHFRNEKKITIEIVGACSDVTYGDKLALKYLPHSKVGFVVKHETVEE